MQKKVAIVAWAVLFISLHGELGLAAELKLFLLPNTQTTGAVCNDGSPAGFYFKAGNPDLWIVHLQGGGWCYDQPSCAQRMSSTPGKVSS